jgi:hypothetical protein
MKIQFTKNHKKQFFFKNRKAELTTKQLVTIIILIVSFIIILFLIFRLNLGGTSDKEICHNSVILKGKTGGLVGALDCRTNYLCISGGKDCEGIPAASTLKIDMGKSPEKIKNEIMKALADEMSDCWWMFGEGKMDYAAPGTFTKVACSICSIVEFDEKLKDISITYEEFYNYLKTTSKTTTQTYLQYLYATDTLDDFVEGFNPDGYLNNQIELDKKYFILTGLAEEGYLTPRWKIWQTKATPQPVVILEKTDENYDKIGCAEFITKA